MGSGRRRGEDERWYALEKANAVETIMQNP